MQQLAEEHINGSGDRLGFGNRTAVQRGRLFHRAGLVDQNNEQRRGFPADSGGIHNSEGKILICKLQNFPESLFRLVRKFTRFN